MAAGGASGWGEMGRTRARQIKETTTSFLGQQRGRGGRRWAGGGVKEVFDGFWVLVGGLVGENMEVSFSHPYLETREEAFWKKKQAQLTAFRHFDFLSHSTFRMASARIGQWLSPLVCLLILLKAESHPVELTLVQTAVAKGAVCLDGSPPAYHFDKGFGAGINNWLVHIEGGGWCKDVESCVERTKNFRGSSKHMEKTISFSGVLGKKETLNPDFYNWNRIKVRYCDGSSFTGDVEAVNPATNLHFRGGRVFRAVIDDLLAKGMMNAKNALLSGCSAGGLASILQCDNFRSLLPAGTNVKCLADAGYFINAKSISGSQQIEAFYSQVVALHGSAKHLPASCTSRLSPGLCFFPQNVVPTLRTPIFLVNAAYDSWQIKNILAPSAADPKGSWKSCKMGIKNCSPAQIQTMQDYRTTFLNVLNGGLTSPSHGAFIDSCYAHCQIGTQETWLAADSPVVGKTTIAKAVGDWYYNRSPSKKIDCPYPCNPTCKNKEFGSS